MTRANIQVGVRGKSCVVLGVEKKSALQLQDPRTVRKVAMLDDHVCVAFAGMSSFLVSHESKLENETDDRFNG
jgi:20S proteasome subunit alpha 4